MDEYGVVRPETDPAQWEEQLAEFRQSRLKTFLLVRTGIEVKYEPTVSIFILAKAGRVPDTLSATVAQLINGGAVKPDLKNFGDMLQLTEILLKTAVKWPPLVDGEGNPGALGLDEIHDQDKLDFFTEVNGEADQLKTFRGKVGRKSVTPPPDGQGLRETAERDPGDKQRVDSLPVEQRDPAGGDTLGSGDYEEESAEMVVEEEPGDSTPDLASVGQPA